MQSIRDFNIRHLDTEVKGVELIMMKGMINWSLCFTYFLSYSAASDEVSGLTQT